jgi:hypothetical protein
MGTGGAGIATGRRIERASVCILDGDRDLDAFLIAIQVVCHDGAYASTTSFRRSVVGIGDATFGDRASCLAAAILGLVQPVPPGRRLPTVEVAFGGERAPFRLDVWRDDAGCWRFAVEPPAGGVPNHTGHRSPDGTCEADWRRSLSDAVAFAADRWTHA